MFSMLLVVLLRLRGIPLVLRPWSTGVEDTGQPRDTVGDTVVQDIVQGGTAGTCKVLRTGSQQAVVQRPFQVA